MELNERWRQRSVAAVWHPCAQMKAHTDAPDPLIAVARAEGAWLYDHEGGRYLDAISSWWTNLFGHGHAVIRDALIDQLSRLDHVMLAGCTHAPVVTLSERLASLTGLGHAFYGNDGASATEIALKMSAHHWRNAGRAEKCRFVGLSGGYHGETVGALAVTEIDMYRRPYAPMLRLAATVPSPDARLARAGEGAEQVARRAAAALGAWLAEHHEESAALIVEPLVQCAAGMAMHSPLYLHEARVWCDRYEVHLVLDEIAVGMGRTGTLFAHEQAGIKPDFLCLSKGLTGGTLPLSVVLTTDAVFAAYHDDRPAQGFLHSHSYSGNPLACRAALATLDLFEQTDALRTNVDKTAAWSRIWQPLTRHERVSHARRCGMIHAWDIATRLPDFARRYARHAHARGLVLRPIGNTVYAMPPYCLSEQDAAWLVTGACAALDATLAEEPACAGLDAGNARGA